MARSLLFLFMLIFGVTVHIVAEEIVIDFAHPKFALLDEEGKNLLSEYAKAYPKIKEIYENMQMNVTVKTVNNHSEESLQTLRKIGESQGLNEADLREFIERSLSPPETLYEIRRRVSDGSNEYSRIDKMVNHPVTSSIRAKLPPELAKQDFIQETEMTLFTPTMGYQLSKNDPRKQHFSLNVRRDFRNPNVGGITVEVLYFDRAPFFGSSGYISLEETLFQSTPLNDEKSYPVVEYVQQKEINGEQIVEIKVISSMHLDSNPDNVHGEIRLSRDSWVAKETFVRSQVVSPGKYFGEIDWVRTSCTYDGVIDGVPLMKTYRRSSGDYDKETQEEKQNRQIHCVVTKIVPGPPDLSEFDVAQFLPPNTKIGDN